MGIFGDSWLPRRGVFGEEDQSPQQDARLAMAAQLLASSGGGTNFSEALGQALMAGQQARAYGQQQVRQGQLDKQNAAYQQAQIQNLQQEPDQIRLIRALQADPSLAEAAQKYRAATSTAEPPASLQEYAVVVQQYAAAGKKPPEFEQWLRTKAQMTPINPTVTLVNGVPTVVQPTRGGPTGVNPLSTPQAEIAAASGLEGAKSGAGQIAKDTATRNSGYIESGIQAADALGTVKRGIELLDEVKTGGINNVALKASNLFGVTGADEGELSANLGKAVLSQLRATFGAQFTEREGARLAEIEAGFGKSTQANKRLLEQAQKILDRAARRGLAAAVETGDSFSADEIRKALNFSLSDKPGQTDIAAAAKAEIARRAGGSK